jgi:NAD(P)-dependent dehydrogenase (short-subunit alcohol dehydrogenase family)
VSGRMEGKKAVVVGAGQPPSHLVGIGRAIAELFAREGAEVCVVDREKDRAVKTVNEIATQGGSAHALTADVGNPSDCAALIGDAHAQMGRIDALVNNVATEEGDRDVLNLEVDSWERIMDVNLRAMWLTARAVIPLMQQQGNGTIVNTSSMGSRTAAGSLFAYGLSKAGVDALTHKLAVGYAPWGIRCNSVLPAWVATQHSMDGLVRAGVAANEEEVYALGRRANPLGRMGSAWDVAYPVLFFSCDESQHVTGVNLPVDGGSLSVVGQYQRPRTAPAR